ncbi:hypothetical protein B0H14DRAFT_2631902 [Mycena olivaceomarginata]|nr:hypothetical protein B0H14DRAFT_2631902 [Mycena olivaceomarginata]
MSTWMLGQILKEMNYQLARMLNLVIFYDLLNGVSYSKDDHNLDSIRNSGADHSGEDLNSENQPESPAPIASNVVGSRPEPLALYAEMLALSGTLKLLMIAQLMLLLFLGSGSIQGDAHPMLGTFIGTLAAVPSIQTLVTRVETFNAGNESFNNSTDLLLGTLSHLCVPHTMIKVPIRHPPAHPPGSALCERENGGARTRNTGIQHPMNTQQPPLEPQVDSDLSMDWASTTHPRQRDSTRPSLALGSFVARINVPRLDPISQRVTAAFEQKGGRGYRVSYKLTMRIADAGGRVGAKNENEISKKGGREGAMRRRGAVYRTSERQGGGREDDKLWIAYIALEAGLSKAG